MNTGLIVMLNSIQHLPSVQTTFVADGRSRVAPVTTCWGSLSLLSIAGIRAKTPFDLSSAALVVTNPIFGSCVRPGRLVLVGLGVLSSGCPFFFPRSSRGFRATSSLLRGLVHRCGSLIISSCAAPTIGRNGAQETIRDAFLSSPLPL